MADFTELKAKQRAMWALGEYDRIAEGLTVSTDQTLRVARIRPGERVLDLALGGWFRITNKHVPPPAGLASPFNWGDPDKMRQLLGSEFRDLEFTRGDCPMFADSPEEIWDLFSTCYGPTVHAAASLDGVALEALRNELLSYLGGYQAADGKVRWGREYLITRAVRWGDIQTV